MVRTGLAALLLLLLIPVAVLTDLSVWATRTVIDERAFSTTVTKALDTDTFRAAMTDAAADTLTDRIEGLDATVRAVGLAAIGIAGDRASIRAWLASRLAPIMASSALDAQRDVLISAAHDVLVHGADATGSVRIVGSEVVVDLGGVVGVIEAGLDPNGVVTPFLQLSPGERQIAIARATQLERVTTAVRRLRESLPILALAMILMALLIVVLAHHRARGIGGVGGALLFAGLVGLGGSWLAGQLVGAFVRAPLAREAVHDIVASLSAVLAQQSALLVVAGVALLIEGWSVGGAQHRRAVAEMFEPL